MGKYDTVRQESGWSPPAGNTVWHRGDLAELLNLSRSVDPRTRRVAAKNLCPCHVRVNEPQVWDRLIELATDPDAGVRSDAIHALADGSPRTLRDRVVKTLSVLHNDPDIKVRKQVRRVLAAFRRTGNVNVL